MAISEQRSDLVLPVLARPFQIGQFSLDLLDLHACAVHLHPDPVDFSSQLQDVFSVDFEFDPNYPLGYLCSLSILSFSSSSISYLDSMLAT